MTMQVKIFLTSEAARKIFKATNFGKKNHRGVEIKVECDPINTYLYGILGSEVSPEP